MRSIIIKISQIIFYWFAFIVLRIFIRLEIKGQENLKEAEDGPIIFASNHNSYIDGGISAASMPRDGFYLTKIQNTRLLLF